MSYWKRVQKTQTVNKETQTYGINVKVHKAIRRKSNGGELFETCCSEAGVQPTVRQYNKFGRGISAAYALRVKVEADARMRAVTQEIMAEAAQA